jgi:hypothetical protein
MNFKSLLGSAVAVASLTAVSVLGTVPAHAAVIDWTLWSSATPGNAILAPGSATGAAGSVGVSYAGELESLVPNYPSWTPTTSYVGGVVGNAPPVAGGIIQLFGGPYGLVDTITFSQAVTDPVMAIWSLGAGGNTAEFSFVQPFSIQAGGPSAEYGGSSIVLCGGNVCGAEGNGTIEFLGTYSQITWTTPIYEDWYGFTVGVAQTPLPSTWTMLFVGFAGLGFFAYRGSKRNASVFASA